MKKSLLALAIMGAFAGAAQAQSSITIYGAIDGGLRHVDNVNAAGDSKTTLGSLGTYNQNRIGFKGVEDLGGGMSARFVLETGFNSGTGALDSSGNPTLGTASRLFQRTATVGLLTPVGAIDFGRQYSAAFKAIAAYEPLGYKYVSIAPVAAAAAGSTGNALALAELNTGGSGPTYSAQGGSRFDNDIQFSTRLGPVTLIAEYAFGEQTGSTSNGSAAAIGTNIALGSFTLGGAYTKKKNNTFMNINVVRSGAAAQVAAAAAALPAGATRSALEAQASALGIPGTAFEDNDQWTIGAAYKVGGLRLTAGYIDDKQDRAQTLNPTGFAGLAPADMTLREATVRNAWLGANYAITPALEVSGAFYKTKREAIALNGATASEGTRDLLILSATYALSKRTNLYGAIDTAKLKNDFRLVSGSRVEDRQSGISVGINHLF